jgi:hypothetical protein
VVLYEMITGHRPYVSDTPVGILLKQASEPLPLPKKYVPDLPQNVESVLLKVLARKPDDRYPDMHSFTNELQDLLDGREVDATAIKTALLREQMTGKVERQKEAERTPVEQGRNTAPPPAPVKTQRGNKFWIVAGGISAGLCACFALVSVGFLAMNGFKSAPASLSVTNVPPAQNTNAATLTALALPPVTISGCTSTDDCPDAVRIIDLFGENETLEYNTEYRVSISQDKKVRFFSGWCTTERKILDENLTNMEFVFTIDDKSYVENIKKEYYDQQDETDSTKQNSCYGVGGVTSGWQKAHTYRVVVGQIFEKQIFDGWDTYPQGEQLYIYLITVE